MSRRPVQQRAEADRLLVGGATPGDIAARLGVPLRTAQRWAAALAPERPRRSPLAAVLDRFAAAGPGAIVASPLLPGMAPAPKPRPALAVVRDDDGARPEHAQPEQGGEPAALVWPPPPLTRRGVALPAPDDEDGVDALVAAAVGVGWSDAVRQQLAAALVVQPSDVDGYRTRVLARRVRRLAEPSEVQLAEELLLVEYSYATAMRHGDVGGATRLLGLRARLLGQDRLNVGVEHSGRVGVEHGLSPAELQEEEERALVALRALPGGLDGR